MRVQAVVLLKLVPTWEGKQETLFALQTSLMTHSCLPYLVHVAHSSAQGSLAAGTTLPKSPTSPGDNPFMLVGRMTEAAQTTGGAAQAWHARLRTLEKIGTCMGWARSGLCWWPLHRGPVKVVLDTSKPDDLLQLSSICRFAFAVSGADEPNHRQLILAAYLGTYRVPDCERSLLKGVSQVRSLIVFIQSKLRRGVGSPEHVTRNSRMLEPHQKRNAAPGVRAPVPCRSHTWWARRS